MIVTIDTNVIFSGLYSQLGVSHLILRLIIEEKLQLAISPQTYLEYYEVLTRNENLVKIRLEKADIEKTLDLLALLAKQHHIYFLLRPNLIDEDDNIFCECAFASNSDYLITSNIKHFSRGELRGFKFKVVTPKDFYMIWRSKYE